MARHKEQRRVTHLQAISVSGEAARAAWFFVA